VAQLLVVEDDERIRAALIRALRERGHSVSSAGTALAGLRQAVADDYVLKPFQAGQLEARIRAVLRRAAGTDSGPVPVTVGDLTVDPRSRRVTLAGRSVELAPKEFDLLAYLAVRSGTVVSKRELLSEVWQLPYGGSDKTVDVHLSWVRRKLGESAAEPRLLQTVRGVGLRLAEPGS
jgi:two-component system KDP operon response regulator KdpE